MFNLMGVSGSCINQNIATSVWIFFCSSSAKAACLYRLFVLRMNRTDKKYDRTLFRNDLQQVDWEKIFNSCNKNCNEMTTTFQEIFQSILDMHAPIKKKRLRSQTAPWMTPLIRELMIKRDAAKKYAERSPAKASQPSDKKYPRSNTITLSGVNKRE